MKLVAGIMPCRGRTQWSAEALECFLAQDYDHKFLAIVDDEDDPAFLTPPSEKAVIYLRLHGKHSIADKRNIACEKAVGSDILFHLDSDDYSAPGRISDQVQRLETSGLSVTGYHSMLFHVEPSGQWWRYAGDKNYALGTSLMYTREWWSKNRFFENGRQFIREDNRMCEAATAAKQLITVDAGELMFARIHRGNSIEKTLGIEYTRAECPESLAVFA